MVGKKLPHNWLYFIESFLVKRKYVVNVRKSAVNNKLGRLQHN